MDIKENFDLKKHNTFGVPSKAALCSLISDKADLLEVIEKNKSLRMPLYPLGGGSNILLTDDLNKWVLLNQMKGITVFYEDEDEVVLDVKSGENWHEFVIHSLENKWYGLENLSLIPGLVGASPIQNIGAYGVEVKDFIVSVNSIDLETAEETTLLNKDIKFDYRNSIYKQALKNKVFITSVRFKLHKKAVVNVKYKALIDELNKRNIKEPSPKDISDAVIAVRKSKLPDPLEIGNSGSFFKNPVVELAVLKAIESHHENVPNYPAEEGKVKLAAGWLIEKAGWKGFRDGDIGVHAKQALVLVNYGSGKGKDIEDLSSKIIADVLSKFGVELEREVNIL
jgi:UDP-N-acetylmuramate dehydrogenase